MLELFDVEGCGKIGGVLKCTQADTPSVSMKLENQCLFDAKLLVLKNFLNWLAASLINSAFFRLVKLFFFMNSCRTEASMVMKWRLMVQIGAKLNQQVSSDCSSC